MGSHFLTLIFDRFVVVAKNTKNSLNLLLRAHLIKSWLVYVLSSTL